jgi:ribosomal protein S18 acetylase RimI-like enzyme
MRPEEFQSSLNRAIERHASEQSRRGIWSETESLAASRAEFGLLLPQGQKTPGHYFAHVVDSTTGGRVGEIWYVSRESGGKGHFWIDWIWIDPIHRRKGFATQVLRSLEEEAVRSGADRIGLQVLTENAGAIALYSKLGYSQVSMRMNKVLRDRP